MNDAVTINDCNDYSVAEVSGHYLSSTSQFLRFKLRIKSTYEYASRSSLWVTSDKLSSQFLRGILFGCDILEFVIWLGSKYIYAVAAAEACSHRA